LWSDSKYKSRNESRFRVNSIQDLTNFIIPQLANYHLLSQKAADFLLFTKIVKLMKNKMHLVDNGLLQVINLRATMNLGLSDLQKSNFPNYNPVARPIISSNEIPDTN
jgi:hypothetical protein